MQRLDDFRYQVEHMSREQFLARFRYPVLVLREMLEGGLKRRARQVVPRSPPTVSRGLRGGAAAHTRRPVQPAHSGGTMLLVDPSSGYALASEPEAAAALPSHTAAERFVWIMHRRRVSLLDPVTVGRSGASDVVVNDFTVSLDHAQILRCRGRRHQIVDLGSTNGTRVADQVCSAGRPVPLESGAPVMFGRVGMAFYTPDAFYEVVAPPGRRGRRPLA